MSFVGSPLDVPPHAGGWCSAASAAGPVEMGDARETLGYVDGERTGWTWVPEGMPRGRRSATCNALG